MFSVHLFHIHNVHLDIIKFFYSPTDAQVTPNFRGPEGSLPCSQELAICPCPEPQESNPRPSILILSDPCVIHYYYYYYYYYYFNYSPNPHLFPSGSLPNLCMHSASPLSPLLFNIVLDTALSKANDTQRGIRRTLTNRL
jgi:hypothetical protein